MSRSHTNAAAPDIMRTVVLLSTIVLSGCSSSDRGRTTQMNPDCTQVSAEEQARGHCMYRPEAPDGM